MSKEEIIGRVLTATPVMLQRIKCALDGDAQGRRKAQSEEDKRLVTITGTARLLAVGRNTVYRLLQTKRLDATDLNGCRRVTMKSIKEFADGMRPANAATAELVATSRAMYKAAKESESESSAK